MLEIKNTVMGMKNVSPDRFMSRLGKGQGKTH